MTALFSSAALDALAVLFPINCAGCGAADRALCSACAQELTAGTATLRTVAGTPVASALEYRGVARSVILAFKEQDRTDLARRLAPALLIAVQAAAEIGSVRGNGRGELSDSPLLLCAVPSSRRAWRRRGYAPVESLLTAAGLRAGLRLRQPRGSTEAQKSLAEQSRWANREGAFLSARRLDGEKVLLVDDVMTTGATIAEAIRAVRIAGGEVVSAATVAFTPRRSPVSNEVQGIRA